MIPTLSVKGEVHVIKKEAHVPNSHLSTTGLSGADPGFGVGGDEIRQGDLRILLCSYSPVQPNINYL